ncbi:MAG: Hint domain-containing protein [Pseudomonadota bacterium]
MDKLNGIIFSEVLADNAGGQAIDTDGDGRTNKADEFVELQNTSTSSVSLAGFEVWSEQNGLLFSFSDTDAIDPGGTATVVGNYRGAEPDGFYDAGLSEQGNFLQDGEGNKFDSLFLVNTATGEYVVLSYGDPPRAPSFPDSFPGTQQVGMGESVNSNSPNGVALVRSSDGGFEESSDPSPGEEEVVCFAWGTRILTQSGEVPVQWLRPGQVVPTRDHGLLPLRAVRRQTMHPDRGHAPSGWLPIVFPTGSIGNQRLLRVSPAHRILVSHPAAELITGARDVLVPAHHFLGYAGICQPQCRAVSYFHLLFDTHVVLWADGATAESLFAGDLTMQPADCLWRPASGAALAATRHNGTAHPVAKSFEARSLMHALFNIREPVPPAVFWSA